MPIYTYRSIDSGCEHCQQSFDLLQRLSDAELQCCPECGAAVKKQLSAPSLAMGGAHLLNEKKIAEKGFTQYRKVGKGVYEKTAGNGPKMIGDG